MSPTERKSFVRPLDVTLRVGKNDALMESYDQVAMALKHIAPHVVWWTIDCAVGELRAAGAMLVSGERTEQILLVNYPSSAHAWVNLALQGCPNLRTLYLQRMFADRVPSSQIASIGWYTNLAPSTASECQRSMRLNTPSRTSFDAFVASPIPSGVGKHSSPFSLWRWTHVAATFHH
ncbi:hypothetical protein M427DRAFT_64706 [Gonapodya prolifera JEL478]|uniref:Uncharacterized protein n=1 Tax=Gonapodya prolifera (strain JEL478) TaxID=1344416 RepID=A0A138ZX86_GONPJ|nr:hypothetical protein M427DRAFT_64706 [Gonapodya prolifera JEL478]|eukprot:KXS09122.1 hypothetical protein M427DRAFT_64706 [Gonapodya prolifera JEL478]